MRSSIYFPTVVKITKVTNLKSKFNKSNSTANVLVRVGKILPEPSVLIAPLIRLQMIMPRPIGDLFT